VDVDGQQPALDGPPEQRGAERVEVLGKDRDDVDAQQFRLPEISKCWSRPNESRLIAGGLWLATVTFP
jgi:hypothetical protein